jgi:hypothetical protein
MRIREDQIDHACAVGCGSFTYTCPLARWEVGAVRKLKLTVDIVLAVHLRYISATTRAGTPATCQGDVDCL